MKSRRQVVQRGAATSGIHGTLEMRRSCADDADSAVGNSENTTSTGAASTPAIMLAAEPGTGCGVDVGVEVEEGGDEVVVEVERVRVARVVEGEVTEETGAVMEVKAWLGSTGEAGEKGESGKASPCVCELLLMAPPSSVVDAAGDSDECGDAAGDADDDGDSSGDDDEPSGLAAVVTESSTSGREPPSSA